MRLYLETSAINRIANEGSYKQALTEIKKRYECSISALSIIELLATREGKIREKLLSVAKGILGESRPLDYPCEIANRFLDAYDRSSSKVDPEMRTKNNESKLILGALNNPKSADENLSETARSVKKDYESGFQEMHAAGRSKLRAAVVQDTGQTVSQAFPNISSFLKHLMRRNVLVNILQQFLKGRPYENRFAGREWNIVYDIDAWRFFFGSEALLIYDRAIKEEQYGKHSNPGRIDVFQAIYLAVVDVFVTADKPLLNTLRIVSILGQRRPRIWTYDKLKTELCL